MPLMDDFFIKNVSDSITNNTTNIVCSNMLISKCQSSTTNIADAAELWRTLALPND